MDQLPLNNPNRSKDPRESIAGSQSFMNGRPHVHPPDRKIRETSGTYRAGEFFLQVTQTRTTL